MPGAGSGTRRSGSGPGRKSCSRPGILALSVSSGLSVRGDDIVAVAIIAPSRAGARRNTELSGRIRDAVECVPTLSKGRFMGSPLFHSDLLTGREPGRARRPCRAGKSVAQAQVKRRLTGDGSPYRP